MAELRGSRTESGRRLRWIARRLRAEYGTPMHGNQTDPMDELVFILLTKRTHPREYLATFDTLKARFQPWSALLAASEGDLFEVMRPLGMGAVRTQQIFGIVRRLKGDFGDVTLEPLRAMEPAEARRYLLGLPGVGEKSARCVLMYSLGYDVSPMDAHAMRVLKRFGFLPGIATAAQAHRWIDGEIPPGLSLPLHVTLVAHGRQTCTRTRPRCPQCSISEKCKRKGIVDNAKTRP